jgi:hypothetical protein
MAGGAIVGSIRAIARTAIPRLVAQGLGSNAIIRSLAGMNLTYRRVNMLADIRKFSGLAKLEKVARSLPGDVLYPRYGMVEAEFRAARRYLVTARMTLFDEEHQQEEERWVSFYSNTRMSKDQWTSAFVQGYAAGRYEANMQIVSVDIASVLHKPGWAL